MAEAKMGTSFENEDLVHCGICHNLLEDPRTLSCLHSFCLKCLMKEVGEKNVFSCPTCSVESKLPDSGVAGLDAMAFIVRQMNEAKIRKELADKDKKVECTACEEGSSATMRCFECDDYLCETCVKSHKRNRHWKQHQLVTVDDLLANKDLQTIPDQNICSKHKGESLMFYCETCDVPICSKCVVITHRHPEHKHAELDEITADKHKKRIKELENESDKVASKIDEYISLTEELERKLNTSSSTAISQLDNIKSQFLENLDKKYKESKDAILDSQNHKVETIQKKVAELNKCRRRVTISKNIAQDVIVKGSEFEIASGYSSVTKSLTDVCQMETKLLPDLYGEMRVSFAEGEKLLRDSGISKQCMVFSGKKRENKKCKQFDEICNSRLRGISFTEDEGVVVSNNSGDYYSRVYSYKGDQLFKFRHQTLCGNDYSNYYLPTSSFCVVYSPEEGGQYFTTNDTHYVNLFSGEPVKYRKRFHVLSPDGTRSNDENSKVQGLALDKDGSLIVGNVTKNYVSFMKTNGTHITSMYVSIKPLFISATPTDNIIVSSYSDHSVQVIDRTGKVVVFTLDPPDGMSKLSWFPTGVCCSQEGAIFVANYRGQVGIFQYCLSDGKYIGCCTKDVDEPWGIALSKDETKLAVADKKCVKMYCDQ